MKKNNLKFLTITKHLNIIICHRKKSFFNLKFFSIFLKRYNLPLILQVEFETHLLCLHLLGLLLLVAAGLLHGVNLRMEGEMYIQQKKNANMFKQYAICAHHDAANLQCHEKIIGTIFPVPHSIGTLLQHSKHFLSHLYLPPAVTD